MERFMCSSVEEFKLFSANELISQIYTGLKYFDGFIEIKEPHTLLESNALIQVRSHFADISNIDLTIISENGYVTIRAKQI